LSHCYSLERIPSAWLSEKRNLEVMTFMCNCLTKRPSNTHPPGEYYNKLTLTRRLSKSPYSSPAPVRYNNNCYNITSRPRISKTGF